MPGSVHFIEPLPFLDEVRAIAETGLHYADNPFDRERYDRLLELAVDGYAAHSGLSPAEVRARFAADVGHRTTKVGVDAAVFDDRDRILLVRRTDNDRWGLVAGWCEPGEAPPQTALRELHEEAGVEGRVEQLVGVFHRPATAGENPHGFVSIVYLCTITGGTLTPQPHEVIELAFRDVDELADDEWHMHHAALARAARDAHRLRDGR